MKEQLITFDTAKLAKEKGFEVCTIKCYDYRDYNNKLHAEVWNTNTQQFGRDMVFAPTQSLLQKWLRDEKDLEVCIMKLDTWEYTVAVIKGEPSHESVMGECDTYEEALEEGLKEALKLC